MVRFFIDRQWWAWSYGGSLFIVFSLCWQVYLDVCINGWFGRFYDMLQQVLSHQSDISFSLYVGFIFVMVGLVPTLVWHPSGIPRNLTLILVVNDVS